MANQNDLDMLDEYDFSGGVRGKYAKRYRDTAGMNKTLFEDLTQSLKEAAAIRRGELAPGWVTEINVPDVMVVDSRLFKRKLKLNPQEKSNVKRILSTLWLISHSSSIRSVISK